MVQRYFSDFTTSENLIDLGKFLSVPYSIESAMLQRMGSVTLDGQRKHCLYNQSLALCIHDLSQYVSGLTHIVIDYSLSLTAARFESGSRLTGKLLVT